MVGNGDRGRNDADSKINLSHLTLRNYLTRCMHGAIGGGVNVLVLYPMYKVTFRQMLHDMKISDAIGSLRKEASPRLLYRGVLPPLCQNACRSALMFANYRFISTYMINKYPQLGNSTSKCIAAFLTGLSEATLFTPFERLQTLLIDHSYNDRLRNTGHSVKVLWRKFGVQEFYRGFTAVAVRNSIGTLFYFRCLEVIESYYPKENIDGVHSFVRDFITGGLVAATGSTLTYPLNVVKIRMQSQLGGDFSSLRKVFKIIYVERGRKILPIYRGAQLNIMKSFCGWGIQTAFVKLFGPVS